MRASPSSIDADAEAGEPRIVQTADFATIDDAIQAAVLDRSSVQPRSAVLAVAGPVDGDEIALTNCPWVVRPKDMFETLGLERHRRAQRFRGAGAGRRGARRASTWRRSAAATPEPNAGRVVLGPGHRARRRRPGPCARPLDPGARRGRPHGHRPAHARATSRSSRISSRSRAASRASRSCAGAASSTSTAPSPLADGSRAALRHAGRDHRRGAGRDRPGGRGGARPVRHLSRPHRRRSGAGLHGQGGVYLTGGIAQKIVPALQAAEFPRGLRGQGAAQRADAARCRSTSSPIRWPRLPALPPMRATPDRFGVETDGPPLARSDAAVAADSRHVDGTRRAIGKPARWRYEERRAPGSARPANATRQTGS